MQRILSFTRVIMVLLGMVMLFMVMNAPMGVVAHHDNEAEHDGQTAVSVNGRTSSGGLPADLPPTTVTSAKSTQTMATPPTDLKVEILSIPDNASALRKAKKNDKISVHYTGTLFSDGSKFDSSLDRNRPFDLTLGVGQVIQGWDQGIEGMVVGEKRKLTIPPNKAYGDKAFGTVIPAHSTLVFEVELLNVTPPHGEL